MRSCVSVLSPAGGQLFGQLLTQIVAAARVCTRVCFPLEKLMLIEKKAEKKKTEEGRRSKLVTEKESQVNQFHFIKEFTMCSR